MAAYSCLILLKWVVPANAKRIDSPHRTQTRHDLNDCTPRRPTIRNKIVLATKTTKGTIDFPQTRRATTGFTKLLHPRRKCQVQ